MAFLSGSVSFSRFHVVGGSPKRLDDALLDKMRAHVIGSQKVARSDGVEIGWVGGRHVLDRTFDEEKNFILDCVHFGFRIDTAKVPPDLLRAYIEMEIEAQRAESPEGHLNGRQIREAKQAAKRRADQEIKEGRYQRMRHFPVLLDTRSDILYAGATQPAVLERLYPLFKETFGKRLEPITSGALGFLTAERAGRLRAIESIEPSRFVRHPERNGHSEICWTAHDSNSRDYLGNEFLMWLWYTLAEDSDTVSLSDKSEAAVLIARQLTLECPWAESGKETISCDSPTRLPEARRAIQSGKLPRKLGLTVSRHGSQYELTLQAETFHVSGAALPKDEEQNGNGHRNGHANGNGNGNGNGRAKMENRVEQVRHLAQTIDLVYDVFLQRRFSSDWNSELNRIATWLRKGE